MFGPSFRMDRSTVISEHHRASSVTTPRLKARLFRTAVPGNKAPSRTKSETFARVFDSSRLPDLRWSWVKPIISAAYAYLVLPAPLGRDLSYRLIAVTTPSRAARPITIRLNG